MRLAVATESVVSDEDMAEKAAANTAPRIENKPPHGRKLAVVGGGPSLSGYLDELRAWDGDIWAINYTARYLAEMGIESIFYTVDALPIPVKAKAALLSSAAHPDTIAGCEQVDFFDLSEVAADGIIGGTTSATRAPVLALRLGYADVSFFGCDGSFAESTHIDRNSPLPEQVIILANGKEYRTGLAMMVQSEELSQIIKAFPDVFHCKSDGLLAAMLEDEQWHVVAVSDALKAHLEANNGKLGLFERPYEVKA